MDSMPKVVVHEKHHVMQPSSCESMVVDVRATTDGRNPNGARHHHTAMR